jgi:hypothetical protein
MHNRLKNILFFLFAASGFAPLFYHIAGGIKPFDATPVWRHILFTGICVICIYGLIKRPKWFVLFFGILTVQQLYSHGSHFVYLMRMNKVNLTDGAVLIMMPVILILLVIDRKKER